MLDSIPNKKFDNNEFGLPPAILPCKNQQSTVEIALNSPSIAILPWRISGANHIPWQKE